MLKSRWTSFDAPASSSSRRGRDAADLKRESTDAAATSSCFRGSIIRQNVALVGGMQSLSAVDITLWLRAIWGACFCWKADEREYQDWRILQGNWMLQLYLLLELIQNVLFSSRLLVAAGTAARLVLPALLLALGSRGIILASTIAQLAAPQHFRHFRSQFVTICDFLGLLFTAAGYFMPLGLIESYQVAVELQLAGKPVGWMTWYMLIRTIMLQLPSPWLFLNMGMFLCTSILHSYSFPPNPAMEGKQLFNGSLTISPQLCTATLATVIITIWFDAVHRAQFLQLSCSAAEDASELDSNCSADSTVTCDHILSAQQCPSHSVSPAISEHQTCTSNASASLSASHAILDSASSSFRSTGSSRDESYEQASSSRGPRSGLRQRPTPPAPSNNFTSNTIPRATSRPCDPRVYSTSGTVTSLAAAVSLAASAESSISAYGVLYQSPLKHVVVSGKVHSDLHVDEIQNQVDAGVDNILTARGFNNTVTTSVWYTGCWRFVYHVAVWPSDGVPDPAPPAANSKMPPSCPSIPAEPNTPKSAGCAECCNIHSQSVTGPGKCPDAHSPHVAAFNVPDCSISNIKEVFDCAAASTANFAMGDSSFQVSNAEIAFTAPATPACGNSTCNTATFHNGAAITHKLPDSTSFHQHAPSSSSSRLTDLHPNQVVTSDCSDCPGSASFHQCATSSSPHTEHLCQTPTAACTSHSSNCPGSSTGNACGVADRVPGHCSHAACLCCMAHPVGGGGISTDTQVTFGTTAGMVCESGTLACGVTQRAGGSGSGSSSPAGGSTALHNALDADGAGESSNKNTSTSVNLAACIEGLLPPNASVSDIHVSAGPLGLVRPVVPHPVAVMMPHQGTTEDAESSAHMQYSLHNLILRLPSECIDDFPAIRVIVSLPNTVAPMHEQIWTKAQLQALPADEDGGSQLLLTGLASANFTPVDLSSGTSSLVVSVLGQEQTTSRTNPHAPQLNTAQPVALHRMDRLLSTVLVLLLPNVSTCSEMASLFRHMVAERMGSFRAAYAQHFYPFAWDLANALSPATTNLYIDLVGVHEYALLLQHLLIYLRSQHLPHCCDLLLQRLQWECPQELAEEVTAGLAQIVGISHVLTNSPPASPWANQPQLTSPDRVTNDATNEQAEIELEQARATAQNKLAQSATVSPQDMSPEKVACSTSITSGPDNVNTKIDDSAEHPHQELLGVRKRHVGGKANAGSSLPADAFDTPPAARVLPLHCCVLGVVCGWERCGASPEALTALRRYSSVQNYLQQQWSPRGFQLFELVAHAVMLQRACMAAWVCTKPQIVASLWLAAAQRTILVISASAHLSGTPLVVKYRGQCIVLVDVLVLILVALKAFCGEGLMHSVSESMQVQILIRRISALPWYVFIRICSLQLPSTWMVLDAVLWGGMTTLVNVATVDVAAGEYGLGWMSSAWSIVLFTFVGVVVTGYFEVCRMLCCLGMRVTLR